MKMDWIWKAVLIILIGTLILRIAGRKSISQMTLSQTVIMIAIGSLLIQPVAGKNIWVTFGVGGVLVLTLIVMEFAQVKFDFAERFLTGRAIPIIVNGQLQEDNLKKLRFTVDQLEMKLRQQNVHSIPDVESATLEPNGQIGYELKPAKQKATKQDIENLRADIESLIKGLASNQPPTQAGGDIFQEVQDRHHKQAPPDRLQ
ncbi:DUF421 domain-containing protein [Halobacillus fulvus]|nr:DUF421 domain-containing protein [Halobacillus fulvus]